MALQKTDWVQAAQGRTSIEILTKDRLSFSAAVRGVYFLLAIHVTCSSVFAASKSGLSSNVQYAALKLSIRSAPAVVRLGYQLDIQN